jgi:DNA-binding transcriptional LysR family regulator
MRNIRLDDLTIAYYLAKTGSLTATGSQLNMTHSTVSRRIDSLEKELGSKLFIRHQRGYRPTDAGTILLHKMPGIESQLGSMLNELSKEEGSVSGDLRITTLSGYSVLLNPAVILLRKEFPKVRVSVNVTDKVIPVESGVAHVSLRAGPKPKESDVIAKKLIDLENGYYASKDYVDRYGLPKHESEFNQHYWAMPSPEYARVPFIGAALKHIDPTQIIYQSNQFLDLYDMILSGLAIGPLEFHRAETHSDLVRVNLDLDKRKDSLWLIYHRDLKNSKRVKAFSDAMFRSLGLSRYGQIK